MGKILIIAYAITGALFTLFLISIGQNWDFTISKYLLIGVGIGIIITILLFIYLGVVTYIRWENEE